MTTIDKGDLYTTAANLIRTHGLAKGAFASREEKPVMSFDQYGDDCQLCAEGALRLAVEAHAPLALDSCSWWPSHAMDPIEDDLVELIEDGSHSVPSFNDQPDTTAEDVAALFDRAAEIHRGETVEV